MQVLHIISNRDNSGGTIAALNLHNALLKAGINSSVLSTDLLTGYLQGKGYRRFGGFVGRIQQTFLGLENLLSKPGLINPTDNWLLKKSLSNFKGIVHIHVTHVAQTSFGMLNALCKNNKVFWTLHDFWPLTGKCIHPTYCTKWLKACNNCPKLNEYPYLKADNTPFLQQKKIDFIAQHKIHFIAPSQWIKQSAENLIKDNYGSISVIEHGIETEIFEQKTNSQLKEKLNITADENVIFFPQGRWDDVKKGSLWYKELVNCFENANLFTRFCFVKIEGEEIRLNQITPLFREISLPFTSNKEIMANYYQIANLTISLSETESFGLCVAESLACKVPVMARNAPGVNELLNYKLALLSDNPIDLFEKIINKHWKKINYQELYNKDFSLMQYAQKHINLYSGGL